MTRLHIVSAAAALLALSACASSSGVLSIGSGRYSITTSASLGRGGLPSAKQAAVQEASATCARNGQQIQVVGEKATTPSIGDGMATIELTFTCAPK